jgi:Zn-dependent protease
MSTRARQRDADESGHGVQIARVGGVPVYLAPSWFLIAVIIVVIVGPPLARARPDLGLLAYGFGVLQALLLLACVLVHEGAHAAVARALGLPVVRIVANLWGGHTSMEAGRSRPGSLALVAAAGPAANAVFAAAAWLAVPLTHPGDLAARLLEGLVIINGSLAVLNILPGMPLDGGQIVESIVWKATGDRNKGSVVAGWCGRVLTVLVVLWFFARPLLAGGAIGFGQLWILLIATVLWGGASQSIQRGRALTAISRIRLADVLRPVAAVPAAGSVADASRARGREVVVTDGRGRPTAYVDAQHLASVPVEARAGTPLSAVASQQHPNWVIEADPAGDVLPVLAALQEFGITVGAVVHQGRLVGLVHARDIGEALSRN